MPEIWLNYGSVDAVVDVRAENLDYIIKDSVALLDDRVIREHLSQIDLSATLVILQNTPAIRRVVSILHDMCESRSVPFPHMMADGATLSGMRANLPQGSIVDEYRHGVEPDRGLVFVSEMGPDGLFGYDTVCSCLMRRFGQDAMLDVYRRRDSDTPLAGRRTRPYQDACKFVDGFEVSSLEVACSGSSPVGMWVGHPSKCDPEKVVRTYQCNKPPVSLLASTGRTASNDTLAGCLQSVWNVYGVVPKGGRVALLAECGRGLGSQALDGVVEGTIKDHDIHSPSTYVEGLENVLFLSRVLPKMNLTLVSALPDFYASHLNIHVIRRAQDALDDMIRGSRRKVAVLPDASTTILRKDTGGNGSAQNR